VSHVLLVAHRTPASAERCARLAAAGARVFEVDVQLSGAGVGVSHFLPFGRGGFVQRDNWRLRWHTATSRDPALAAIVSAVPAACRVLLDIKETTVAGRRRLVDILAATLPDRDRYRVCGGAPDDLERARAAGFRTWRTVGNRSELAPVLDSGPLPDEAVSIRHSLLDRATVERLHAVVPSVVAWTVNDPARGRRLRGLGVDGVTTDRPRVLRTLAADGPSD
jgi:glycerophosphoryl diester phosphodiesterase